MRETGSICSLPSFTAVWTGIAIISDANPLIPLTAVFPLGTVLVIPIVEDSDMHVNTDLPPWKR